MASEPFTIQFESFDGGLSQGPYTGADNQYSYNYNGDFWTEPGTVTSIGSFRDYEITSNASYKSVVLSMIRSTDDTKKYPALLATGSSWTLTFANIGGAGAITEILQAPGYYEPNPSLVGRRPIPLLEYGTSLIASSGFSILQVPTWTSGSSLYTSSGSWNGTVSDLVESFGYLYVSKTAATSSSPGAIARYDLVTSASLVNDGASYLDPAIQLAPGWGPICMANYGDYIAVAALKTKQTDFLDWSIRGDSRIYIWDGISNTFDTKVDVQGSTITAIHVHGGQLFAFASRPGGIDILRYAGGNAMQKVGSVMTTMGTIVDTSRTDTNVPWVRKQSISSFGSKIYFGTISNGGDESQGNLYSFDVATGVVDMIQRTGKGSCLTVFLNNETRLMSLQNASNSTYSWKVGYTPFTNDEVHMTSTTRFAPIGKKMKIKRALVRHSYLPGTSDQVNLYLNYNLTRSPRAQAGTSIVSVTGSSLSTPGIGDNAAYEHAYTFSDENGAFPLVDSFNLSLEIICDLAAYHRPRVFLPIVIEGEYIDSPN